MAQEIESLISEQAIKQLDTVSEKLDAIHKKLTDIALMAKTVSDSIYRIDLESLKG